MVIKGPVQAEHSMPDAVVLVVNKATGDVVRETTLGEVKASDGVARLRGDIGKWIESRPMTNSMHTLRFKDDYDPHEKWAVRSDTHPVLIYDLVTRRAVVVPCTVAGCSYLNVSEITFNQALGGGVAVASRFVCLPLRCMGQYNGISKRELRMAAVDHLYAKVGK